LETGLKFREPTTKQPEHDSKDAALLANGETTTRSTVEEDSEDADQSGPISTKLVILKTATRLLDVLV
jgi:hypothetical protein